MISRVFAPALLCVMLTSGCAPQRYSSTPQNQKISGAKPAAFPADDLNRPINLKEPAKRVVVIGPGAVETMFYLNAQSLLVGRDDYADHPTAAKKIAIGGNYQGPNIEQCLALSPDLVVVQGETSNRARFDMWQKKLGVPVAALTTTNFKSLGGDVRKLGIWIGKPKEANALAKKFETPAPSSPVVARALIQTSSSGWIAGTGTLVADTARRAGYSNIADELGIEGYKQVNVESLLVKQPDVIIVPSDKPRAQVLARLRADAGFSKLDCVKKGRVLVVDSDLLLRPGPRLLDGVAQLKAQKFDK